MIDLRGCTSETFYGRITATEYDAVCRRQSAGSRRPCLWFGGAGSTNPGYFMFTVQPDGGKYVAPVLAGVPVVASGLAGGYTFGNDAMRTAVGQARTFWTSQGWDLSKVAIVATSMGAMAAAYYATQWASTVASITLQVPLLDLVAAAARNAQGLQSAAWAAYGGQTGFDANAPGRSMNDVLASLPKVPTRLYYSADDTVQTSGERATFAAGQPCTQISLGSIGHSVASTALDERGLASFVAATINA